MGGRRYSSQENFKAAEASASVPPPEGIFPSMIGKKLENLTHGCRSGCQGGHPSYHRGYISRYPNYLKGPSLKLTNTLNKTQTSRKQKSLFLSKQNEKFRNGKNREMISTKSSTIQSKSGGFGSMFP